MPTYEYFCEDCQLVFTVVMTMTDFDPSQVICPHCQGRNVTRQYSDVFVRTSKKS